MKTFITIESGKPFEAGTAIPVRAATLNLGRQWQEIQPDVAFEDERISRRHAQINYREGRYELLDQSKHGTEVNGRRIEKGVPYTLKHQDRISLAYGAAILSFHNRLIPGETQEVGDLLAAEKTGPEPPNNPAGLYVDENRREVLLRGRELRPRITGYEFELLALLFRNRGTAVSHYDIINCVWRGCQNRDAGLRQNVTTLVHRLKSHLGDYGKYIVNIPSYGYRLENESETH